MPYASQSYYDCTTNPSGAQSLVAVLFALELAELLNVLATLCSYYGVFDGHEGGLAAAFAAHRLHKYIAANLALAKL